MKIKPLLLSLIFYSVEIFSTEISRTPYVIAYTPNSVLSRHLPKSDIRYAGTRARYSTCSAVAWSKQGDRLLAVNMQDCSIELYAFDPKARILNSLRNFNNKRGADLARPESIAFSPDGSVFAVPNMKSGKIHIYQTPKNEEFDLRIVKTVQGKQSHGIRFSSDGRYLAYASTSEPGICLYDITEAPRFIQSLGMPFFPLKAKTIDFSPDGRYLAAGYCTQLTEKPGGSRGLIAIYEFDAESGRVKSPTPVSYTETAPSVETLVFSLDGSSLFSVDQVYDRVFGHEFDPVTGKIGNDWIALDRSSELDLPHGLSFSPDGRFLAVSNYGGDKITVYEVFP